MTIKNEEWYVGMAIRSILPYVEKLFIIDTGSTDSTSYEIIKLNSDKIDLEQVDGFSQGVDHNGFYNRPYWCNKLIKKCLEINPDYLLNIDADEYFTPKTFEILQKNPNKKSYTFSTFDLTSLEGHYFDGSDDFGRDTLNYPHTRIIKTTSNYCFISDYGHPEYGYQHAQGSYDGKIFLPWDFVSNEICHLHFRWIGPKSLRDNFKISVPNTNIKFNQKLIENIDKESLKHLKSFDKQKQKTPPTVFQVNIPKKNVVANYSSWKKNTLIPASNKKIIVYFEYFGGGLGDVFMQLPAFRYLKTKYPDYQLIVIVDDRYMLIYKHCKYIDFAIPLKHIYQENKNGTHELKIPITENDIFLEAKGDLVSNLNKHILQSEFERICKEPYFNNISLDYELSLTTEEQKESETIKKEILRKANGKKLIAIGPAFTYIHKIWSTEYWEQLIDLLHEKNYFVVSFGVSKDLYVSNVDYDAKGIYDIHLIPTILDIFDGIFVLNSGMLHIAGTNPNIPIILISPGPFPPEKYLLYRHNQLGYKMTYIGNTCQFKKECLDFGFCKDENKNLRKIAQKEFIRLCEKETKQPISELISNHALKYLTWHYCYKTDNKFECCAQVTPEKVFNKFVSEFC